MGGDAIDSGSGGGDRSGDGGGDGVMDVPPTADADEGVGVGYVAVSSGTCVSGYNVSFMRMQADELKMNELLLQITRRLENAIPSFFH